MVYLGAPTRHFWEECVHDGLESHVMEEVWEPVAGSSLRPEWLPDKVRLTHRPSVPDRLSRARMSGKVALKALTDLTVGYFTASICVRHGNTVILTYPLPSVNDLE
jgi:hypothetical protein